MPRPIVQISQRVANITPTIDAAEQKVVLVGPKYDLRVYDPLAADNSDSRIIPDYAPFTGANLADINFAEAPEWEIPGLSNPVDTVLSSPRFYIEDAEFSVVFKSALGVPSENDAIADEKAEGHRRLYFDDRSSNWADLKHRAASPFAPKVGDTIHIGHNIASQLRFDVELTAAQITALNDPASTYSLNIGGVGANAADLLRFDQSNSALYLHSAEVTAASAGDAAVLTVTNGVQEVLTINSSLSIPADQKMLITKIDGTKAEVSSPIHSFPLSNDAAKRLDFRVDRSVASEFGASFTFLEILAEDDQDDTQSTLAFSWVEEDSEVYVTAHNAPDLRDTSLPNIRTAVPADCVEHVITGGNIFATFRALDSSQSTVLRDINASNLSEAGLSNPLNPIGLAANIAVANAGATSISVLALEEDSVAGYTKALSILSGDPDAYAIVPLSDDLNNVILPYTTEAERLSQPDKSKFRIVIGASRPCPTRRYLAGSETANATADLFLFGADGYLLVDPEATFVASGVDTASKVSIAGTDYDVSSVLDDSRLLIPSEGNGALGALIGNSIEYTVSSDISTDRQAQVDILTSRLGPVTSKRLVMVYPGTCAAQGFLDLPGYYLSAAIAGMLAVFEPHRPKNNILLAGITSISTSNLGFFSDSQIDELSDSGYFVLVQDTSDSAPYCVHQVTVAYEDYAETQELGELSVLNNYDYVSKFLGKALEPFVGSWNVTPQAISTIHATLDAALIRLQSDWTDIIGSPVLNYTIENVSVSESSRGTINVSVSVRIPRVLNTIVLEIVSA